VIENQLRESLFIDNCMVVGSNEDFASAIITADVNGLHYWCNKHKIPYETDEDILKNPQVQARLQEEINKVNANLAAHEKLKNCRWIIASWSPLTGELSQTLKLKRAKLIKKYEPMLEEIFGHTVAENK
jgi:long-chain acyl-CoA synthetase